MSRSGHLAITEVRFPGTPGGPPGIEVLDFAGLAAAARGRGADEYAPFRPAFHTLLAVDSGVLLCSVDFAEYAVAEGGWVWVRPGQVLQIRSDLTAAEGTAVLFQPGFLSPATAGTARVDQGPSSLPLVPTGTACGPVRHTLEMLASEYRRLTDLPLEVHVEVVRHLLSILVLRLSHLPGDQPAPTAAGTAFRRFQQAVERDFTRSHHVADYAAGLGYSVRTLTRATQAAVGCGAKRFIDDRILLEAKRLLLHTDLPATAVGERLGFPSATVFNRFFRERAGETPTAFRLRATGAGPQPAATDG
ncbi:AraC family transcriptional regulator [Streptomyces sp. Ru73]|uniref:helix-turn-helix transcriptional regulator n=1 Tax=Streptomyces sp. Ru73 TaxID=2080748 RepID=UPI000CDE2B45|nr:helix-turn-helix transcriptional regulator [Streptomyces sp. Ru73]POX42301.1 AraC family transcriptional regulator [Streptomyces sp. Ru73]